VSKTSKETVNQKPVSVKRLIQIPPNCLHVVVGEHNVLVSRLLLKLPLPPFEEIKHLLERCLQDDVDLFMSGFQSRAVAKCVKADGAGMTGLAH